MFFSIIIPVYNVEKYLNQCVDSILRQTFHDYELILVDDGSPDNSGAICDEYARKDARIKVIHKENGGLSDARNYGTREASGEYIVYIDSDDYLSEESFLQEIRDVATNDSDLILYKYKKYYEDSGKFSEVGFNFPAQEELKDKDTGYVLKRLVETDSFYCAAWMKAIRRSVLVDNVIEFKKGILSEDQEWYYHVVLCAKRFSVINKPFIVYRQRSGSITSTTGSKNMKDNIQLIEFWGNTIQSMDMDECKKFALMSSLGKLYANLLIAFTSLNANDKRKYKGDLKKLSWLMKYDLNPRTKKLKNIFRILGFNGTVCLLSIIRKLKR